MNKHTWISSILVFLGALTLGTLPLWSEVGSQGDKSAVGAPPAGEEGIKGSKPIKPGAESASAEDIKKVQEALKSKGLYKGPINGVMESQTSEALKAFQQDRGLKATGVLDDDTKAALGLGQGGEPKSGGGVKPESGAPKTERNAAVPGAKPVPAPQGQEPDVPSKY
jgi:peptidoglycan hydrolase-like protein with peptidoglycan-binding domain